MSEQNTRLNAEALLSLDNLVKIKNFSLHPEDYNFIPTIKYRKDIASSCKNLSMTCGFDRFAIAIIWGNKKIWLSNTYDDLAIPYKLYQLSRIDTSIAEENYLNKTHFFPAIDITSPIDLLYRKIISELYKFNNIYTLVRSCYEANILLVAGTTKSPNSENQIKFLYKTTLHAFENFAIQFLNENIYKLAEFDKSITYLRLFYDQEFRKKLIKNQVLENIQQITSQESLCLHWISYGKTAQEAATILDISAHTVRQHLKNAIRKLRASNVTNAVFKARIINLI